MSDRLTVRLVLVRHGETLANREFRYIGVRDDALSEHGRWQAAQLAESLASFPLVGVYSSPRQRAYNTALAIAERHSLTVQVEEALSEVSFGTWEGLSRAEVLARSIQDSELLQAWEHDPTLAPPEGESFVSFQERVCALVERLCLAHPGQTIVLVSHVGPIKVLLCRALGLSLSAMGRIFLDPAAISVLDWNERPIVRLVNSHGHLGWQEARWLHSLR